VLHRAELLGHAVELRRAASSPAGVALAASGNGIGHVRVLGRDDGLRHLVDER
jgi:hypothetical protein